MTKRVWFLLFAATLPVILPVACGGAADGEGAGDETGGTGSGGLTSGGAATSSGGFSTDSAAGGTSPSGGAASSGGTGAGLGGLGGEFGDFFPQDLPVTTTADGCWELVLTAFTLKEGAAGLEVYGALRNDSPDDTTCAVQLAIELFDESGASLAAAANTLKHPSHYLYAIDAETDAIVACLGPGETAMGVVSDFPPELELGQVARLSYRCPSLRLTDLEPIDAASVSNLAAVTGAQGTSFTGTFENHLEVDLERAFVAVVATSESGRPLGMVTVLADAAVPALGSWTFETPSLVEPGAQQAVFLDFLTPY